MKETLDNIKKLKAELEKLSPLKPEDQQKLDKKFRLEWNYNSNHIEGNTLTYGETELLLIFDQTKGNHELREYEEMKNHDVALKLIYDLANDKERELTEKFVRELNEILLVRPFYKEAITPDGQPTRRLIKIGEYKSFPNSVRLQNGEIFKYASPAETPALMNELINWYQSTTKNTTIHPIEVAAELHCRFVCIHPFDDGNGRIARLLMNYHIIKNNLPPLIIKSADKKNYLFALHEADTGNIEAFKKYIAEQLIWSLEISIKAANGESIDEMSDWEKKVSLLKRNIATNEFIENEKNAESIKKVIAESFIPLAQNLVDKVSLLDDMFLNTEKWFYINGKSRKFDTLANLAKEIADISIQKLNEIDYLGIVYGLNQFRKNGLNTFDCKTGFIIKFKKYYFNIFNDISAELNFKKYYHQIIEKDEIEDITNILSDSLLETIKEKSQTSS